MSTQRGRIRGLDGRPGPVSGGPHRLFDWWSVPLKDVKGIRKALDCTVNDVVLTVVTGAFREFSTRRELRPEKLDFQTQDPVSVVRDEEKRSLGNRVSTWLVELRSVTKTRARSSPKIRAATHELKEFRSARDPPVAAGGHAPGSGVSASTTSRASVGCPCDSLDAPS